MRTTLPILKGLRRQLLGLAQLQRNLRWPANRAQDPPAEVVERALRYFTPRAGAHEHKQADVAAIGRSIAADERRRTGHVTE